MTAILAAIPIRWSIRGALVALVLVGVAFLRLDAARDARVEAELEAAEATARAGAEARRTEEEAGGMTDDELRSVLFGAGTR